MITYKAHKLDVRVYVERRLCGTIKRSPAGWRYWPKGSKIAGKACHSLEAVKRDLERE